MPALASWEPHTSQDPRGQAPSRRAVVSACRNKTYTHEETTDDTGQ